MERSMKPDRPPAGSPVETPAGDASAGRAAADDASATGTPATDAAPGDPPARSAPAGRRKMPIWVASVRLVVLAVLGFFLGLALFNYVVMPRLLGHGDEVQVPDVVGRALANAREMLEDERLKVGAVTEQWSGVYPDGYVIGQVPAALTRVKQGREVRLVVSVGSEGQEVPDLSGVGYRDAQVSLARSGLRVGGIAYVYSEIVAKDGVIATEPERGAKVEPGARVDLLVSLGPLAPTFLLPDLRRHTIEDVRGFFARSGIRVVERPREVYGVPAGEVIEQSPPPGYRIRPGELVEVAVSSPGRGEWR
jgi:serine/threonine-protein kinase